MKKQLGFIGFILVMVLALAACSSSTGSEPAGTSGAAGGSQASSEPETMTVTHELGETVVEKNPKKVVVFDYGALETLDVLGVEIAGVPQASLPPHLEKYADEKYENIGTLKEPDFEAIAGIDPDLIVISGRQLEAYEELSKIGSTIYVAVDSANYMESFIANVKLLGEIFDKAVQAEKELDNIDQVIDNIKAVTPEGEKALVILTTGGKVSAYGSGSRFGILHDVFGVQPADENIEASTHGMSVSFEYIMEQDPDYLFVVDRDAVVGGDQSAKEVIENELVKNTKAYQNGNIVYLDPGYWYLSGGGLTSVVEMAKQVEEALK